MAFNKQKTLDTAQKFLNQGKIPQAIAEYQTILRHEPKDQITLMTVGDLFVRSGDTQQALEYYEKLAQLFLGDGFISKGIAIYKKIAKIAPEETQPLEKLAELYVQQGVMSEARPLYLQMAEAHLKGGRQQKAVEVLRKLLELEPDNLRVQLKLAELYQAIGQKEEASRAFLNSAHRLFDRGEFAEARKMADRALTMQASNTRAATLKARAMAATGEAKEAVKVLEAMPGGGTGIESARYLSELYLQTGQSAKAVALGKKMLTKAPENHGPVFEIAQQLVDGGEAAEGLNLLGEIREKMMEAGDYERLTRALSGAADKLAGRMEPLEWLLDAYRRANDTVRFPGALDQMAEAYASAGQNERALELFEELVKLQPEDADTLRRMNQIRQKLGMEAVTEDGGAAPPVPVEVPAEAAPPPFAAEMEVTPVDAAPVVEAAPPPDADTEKFITQALTDVDLFSSYGLSQKAIDLLESVLQRAPRHLATLEKLLDLYLGAGNDRRTAEIAGQLEQIYKDEGDLGKSDRFGELRRRYQRAAGVAVEEVEAAPAPAPAEFAVPSVTPEPTPAEPAAEVEAQPAEEAEVHEVDLSEEWAAVSQPTEEAQAVEAQPVEEIVIEEAAPAQASPEPVPIEPEPAPPEPVATEPEPAAVEAAPEPKAEEAPAEEYEIEMAPAAPAEPATAEKKAEMTTSDFLSDLAAEVGDIELAPAQPEKAKAAGAAAVPAVPAAAQPGQAGELQGVFDEFRAELGEMGDEKEDPETHYNLGIAYREMGLLEEAIGEFQKVSKLTQSGTPFRYAMQCCTLLALSFMDKGQPAIAAMWYRKALETPGLDQETVLALRYDLGVSLEAAGEPKAALDSFNQVYAMNIDYRDVGERIAQLQKR